MTRFTFLHVIGQIEQFFQPPVFTGGKFYIRIYDKIKS
jgi:hypothetical protein